MDEYDQRETQAGRAVCQLPDTRREQDFNIKQEATRQKRLNEQLDIPFRACQIIYNFFFNGRTESVFSATLSKLNN